MIFREAVNTDIVQMQIVRNAVKENPLSNPELVTDNDCEEYITKRGKGWVCEWNKQIVGFAIADLQDNNIWALFVHPDFEKKGIGKQLHELMLDWYFNYKEKVWLGTAPHTRAEAFYKKAGWRSAGMHGTNEVKFEMNASEWKELKKQIPHRNQN